MESDQTFTAKAPSPHQPPTPRMLLNEHSAPHTCDLRPQTFVFQHEKHCMGGIEMVNNHFLWCTYQVNNYSVMYNTNMKNKFLDGNREKMKDTAH